MIVLFKDNNLILNNLSWNIELTYAEMFPERKNKICVDIQHISDKDVN